MLSADSTRHESHTAAQDVFEQVPIQRTDNHILYYGNDMLRWEGGIVVLAQRERDGGVHGRRLGSGHIF